MKKICSVIIILSIILTLSACKTDVTGAPTPEPNTDPDQVSAEPPTQGGDPDPVSAEPPSRDDGDQGDKPAGDPVPYIPVFLPETQAGVGEKITTTDIATGEPALEYTLVSASTCESIQTAGGIEDPFLIRNSVEAYNAEDLLEWKASECMALLCTFSITNLGVESSDQHIGEIRLVNADPETKEVRLVCEQPVYFSAAVSDADSPNFYHYDLPKGETKEVMVAWLVGPEYDISNLYLSPDFGSYSGGQYFSLGL